MLRIQWAAEWAGQLARRAATLLLVIAAAGCVTAPPLQQAQDWPARRTELQSVAAFELTGRLAVAAGEQGTSGGLHWRQQGTEVTAEISGPLGAAAHIHYDSGQLQLTASDGTNLNGDAARARLKSMLGFDVPFDSLRFWVLGVGDPASPATEQLDSLQRLQHLQQGEWGVDYASYAMNGDHWLPERLTVQRANLKLKLFINRWQL